MSAPGGGAPGGGGGVAYAVAVMAVVPQVQAFWQANIAFNGARTLANLNAAILAGNNAVNVINANLAALGPNGPILLNAVQGTLANLQALANAAAALVALGNMPPPGGGGNGGGAAAAPAA